MFHLCLRTVLKVIKNEFANTDVYADITVKPPPRSPSFTLHLAVSRLPLCVLRCLHGVVKPALQTGPLKSSKEEELNVGDLFRLIW